MATYESKKYQTIPLTATQIADGSVTDAEYQFINTLSSNAQTQISGSLPKAGGTMTGDIAHASNFGLDIGGEITLDADGGKIRFKDAGTEIGRVVIDNSQDLEIVASVQDKDIKFRGDDGGTGITALTLDMSAGGALVCNSDIAIPDNGKIELGAGDDLQLFHDTANNNILSLSLIHI